MRPTLTNADDQLTEPIGLTTAEAETRRAEGKVNLVPDRTSRTYVDIVRANILTRFNAIISVLAAVILIAGELVDALFVVVMVVNAAVGIVQEIRAKRTLDRLAVLIAPSIIVVRDNDDMVVEPRELVLDDVIRLSTGDQVPVDAMVIESQALEVDESALTGESDPIPKHSGDDVLSGSAVVAGSALARATRVGTDAWIHQLVEEAKEFVLTTSELRSGVDQLLRVVTWILVPLSGLLVWSQLRSEDSLNDALVSAVAGVVGLVPQGLVLLVSMAMAVAIVRLARNHVVVQELHAVEGLARVDVLCVDKTGTLTTGHFEVDEIRSVTGDRDALMEALSALVESETSPTASTAVLAGVLPTPPRWRAVASVAFSSSRKWSGTTFEHHGTWVLGAPEVLLDACDTATASALQAEVDPLTADAKRVLMVAHSPRSFGPADALPVELSPLGLVVLAEQLRSDAAEIMDYFARQQVNVKIISGDSAGTVSAVARRLEVVGADRFIDLREVGSDGYDRIIDEATVFGRVQPEQKRELVDALQRAGHTVAMTGDGVNDIPALKRADIGIAMDTATSATKSVAQLVLLDGRFDRLPNVVAEGRRVVANMERVSTLFVTKTVYATLFALVIGVSGAAFPFLPRHMSVVSTLTIGVPAFLLSFRAADQPCRPGYLRRVLAFAIPAGVVAAAVTLMSYWFAKTGAVDANLDEARTISTLVLTTISFWVLYRLMLPIDRYDVVLLVGLIAVFAGVLVVEPIRDALAFDWPNATGVVGAAVITVGSIVVLQIALRWMKPQRWRWLQRFTGSERPLTAHRSDR